MKNKGRQGVKDRFNYKLKVEIDKKKLNFTSFFKLNQLFFGRVRLYSSLGAVAIYYLFIGAGLILSCSQK